MGHSSNLSNLEDLDTVKIHWSKKIGHPSHLSNLEDLDTVKIHWSKKIGHPSNLSNLEDLVVFIRFSRAFFCFGGHPAAALQEDCGGEEAQGRSQQSVLAEATRKAAGPGGSHFLRRKVGLLDGVKQGSHQETSQKMGSKKDRAVPCMVLSSDFSTLIVSPYRD